MSSEREYRLKAARSPLVASRARSLLKRLEKQRGAFFPKNFLKPLNPLLCLTSLGRPVAPCESQSFHLLQQLPRFTQQRLNLPSLGDRIPGEQAVLARVLVCPWRAGSRCAAVHAASLPAAHGR